MHVHEACARTDLRSSCYAAQLSSTLLILSRPDPIPPHTGSGVSVDGKPWLTVGRALCARALGGGVWKDWAGYGTARMIDDPAHCRAYAAPQGAAQCLTSCCLALALPSKHCATHTHASCQEHLKH